MLNLWHSSGFHADYLVTKCGVLMMSLFVFFTTTMSVSFTLRETQTRMLKFTGLFTPPFFFSSCIHKFCHSSHVLQESFESILLLLDFLMGESNGYKDLHGNIIRVPQYIKLPCTLPYNSLLSIYCSAASTPCSTSASNISVDLCACN